MAVTIPRRSIPGGGRDRLGILGGPMGASVASLQLIDAEFRVGTNDFIIELTCTFMSRDALPVFPMWLTDDAGRLGIVCYPASGTFQVYINGFFACGVLAGNVAGRTVHLMVFGDRSGDAYFYLDGAYLGTADISSRVATDIDSDFMKIGGWYGAGYSKTDVCQLARLFVISPANFPTAAQRAAIAAERFQNPDAESPTLAARAAYATERRLDVNFNDNKYNATTLVNEGTGGNLTVGGGLFVSQTVTHVERSARVRPEEDWYTLDTTHEATNAAADVGFISGGSYICELIVKDVDRIARITDNLMEIDPAGTADHFRYRNGNASTWVEIQASAFVINSYFRSTLEIPHADDGLVVVHMTVDRAAGRLENILFNGNKWFYSNNAFGPINLSGNCLFKFGDASTYDGLLACRVWCAAADMPSDLDDILYRRVYNPWVAPTTLAGLTLMSNYECRIDATVAQGATSTLLKNLANPGTGDLTISGGGTMLNSTTIAVRGM